MHEGSEFQPGRMGLMKEVALTAERDAARLGM
jgi:hypothetical protein